MSAAGSSPSDAARRAVRMKVTKSVDKQKNGARAERVVARPQAVSCSFRVWRSASAFEDDGAVALDASVVAATQPAAKLERGRYVVGAPAEEEAAVVVVDDDLDDWLHLPRAVAPTRPEWTPAVDAALSAACEGEALLWADGEWIVEAELFLVLRERDVVRCDSEAAQGHHGGLFGAAKLRRLKEALAHQRPRDGAIVTGVVRVLDDVNGATDHVPASALGLKGWTTAAAEAGAASFEAIIGSGLLAEGFEEALRALGPGAVARLALSGECLLADGGSEAEKNAAVPAEWWTGKLREHAAAAAASKEERLFPRLVVEVRVEGVNVLGQRAMDPVGMTMDEKEAHASRLRARGAALYAARRFRRAEAVWHAGVRLFGMIKPEDSAMDPGDANLRENNRGRAASIPLLLNEALVLRRRGALKEAESNLEECLVNDAACVKALLRRGQIRVDLDKFEAAEADLRKARDLDAAVAVDVDRELRRLATKRRAQDAKDGKYFRGAFGDDREPIYHDKAVDGIKVRRARDDMRALKARRDRGDLADAAKPVTKLVEARGDWTRSYSEDRRPVIASPAHEPGKVEIPSLRAELDEISDEEEEALRTAKEAYYNEQLGLGNMRIHVPPPPPPS